MGLWHFHPRPRCGSPSRPSSRSPVLELYSPPITTAAQESSNLRGGRQLLEELDDKYPRDFPFVGSFSDHERSSLFVVNH